MANRERLTKKIVTLNLDLIRYQEAIARIVGWGADRIPSFVCFANVHMTIEAYDDPAFAKQVNAASLVVTDGVPLVKSLATMYAVSQDRIAGMDVFPDLIKASADRNLKLFFFGTTDDVLHRIRERIIREYPNVAIAGMISPPFGTSLDDDDYIRLINDSGANLVFVALGCPKQEKWMARNSPRINAVLLGVGGAFPVYAGLASRAPEFMRRAGLEWLYRLAQEPGRLFKRYFYTNTKFLYLMTRARLARH